MNVHDSIIFAFLYNYDDADNEGFYIDVNDDDDDEEEKEDIVIIMMLTTTMMTMMIDGSNNMIYLDWCFMF